MPKDYLWDGSGEPDPEVERLELLLGRLRHNRPAPDFSAPTARRHRLSPGEWFPLRAAAAVVLLLGAAGWVATRDVKITWDVARLEGSPQIGSNHIADTGRLGVGQWLQTDGVSRARMDIGSVGQVEVEPNTRLRMVEGRLSRHRLALDRGVIHAIIWAPPRFFSVETPSAVAVDLGCAYSLEVDASGAGLLRVTSGWVGFEREGRESFVPAGALCATRPGIGPGTPYFEDASEKFRAALAKLDFEPNSRATAPGPAKSTSSLGTVGPTGSMGATRSGHTSTLLPDGRVLITGGMERNGVFFSSAELYDAAIGKFTGTSSMSVKRVGHTATRLPDGRVLVAGGITEPYLSLATAEVYDRASGAWTSTGKLITPRNGQTATLLSSGKVLITGGTASGNEMKRLASAELYDPVTATFTPAGEMTAPRVSHTATLLKDGKVLITGGSTAGRFPTSTVLASAELYDPATGKF
ncbi:MAG: hypothetical protein HY236_12815, partial [Acidobacteria bacterium]|nr:hypothetical protein [Acidobacteriota bacterium]